MDTIYKYVLKKDLFLQYKPELVNIPVGAKFLSCGLDLDGSIAVWYLIQNEEERAESRTHLFYAFWTGERFNSVGLKYLGTVNNGLIYHIFEEEYE